MKAKKIFAVALTCLLGATSLVGAVGCGKKQQMIKDGKTINIRAYKAGHGTEWMNTLKRQFEAAYKEEGYKVNIAEPTNDMISSTCVQDMATNINKNIGVDLYITSNVRMNDVGELGNYGVLAADMEELVWNKAPIGYDRQEESTLVSEKLEAHREKFTRDDNGVMYGFQYTASVAGMSVNTQKLSRYGLEIPKTTNEMMECIDTIYRGTGSIENSTKSGIYPLTFFSGTNGYVNCAIWTFMNQYDQAQYEKFWSMQEKTGESVTDMLTNGYEVFDLPCLEEALTMTYALMDQRIATHGSTTQTLDAAQAAMMTPDSGAVFMLNGSWMLNEVRLNYKDYLNDVTFVRMPLISSLGTKLMGTGTKYALDAETCDDVLSYVAGMVDEGKEIAEMISAVSAKFNGLTLDTAVVQEIARARGAVVQRGTEDTCFITANSPVKEIAALFLRMMASDDFAQTWLDTAYSTTAYSPKLEDLDASGVPYVFVKDAAKISTNKYANMIEHEPSGLRKKLRRTDILTHISHVPSTITSRDIVSIYDGKGNKEAGATLDSTYRVAAQGMVADEVAHATQEWNNWLKTAGLN